MILRTLLAAFFVPVCAFAAPPLALELGGLRLTTDGRTHAVDLTTNGYVEHQVWHYPENFVRHERVHLVTLLNNGLVRVDFEANAAAADRPAHQEMFGSIADYNRTFENATNLKIDLAQTLFRIDDVLSSRSAIRRLQADVKQIDREQRKTLDNEVVTLVSGAGTYREEPGSILNRVILKLNVDSLRLQVIFNYFDKTMVTDENGRLHTMKLVRHLAEDTQFEVNLNNCGSYLLPKSKLQRGRSLWPSWLPTAPAVVKSSESP